MKLLARATTRRTAVAVALSAALATSGCSHASPGVVAYVGDAQITETQLKKTVAAVSTTVGPGQTVSNQAVISAMIQGELAAQIATAKGISLTDAQRDTVLKSSNLAPLLDVPDAKPIVYDIADAQLVSQRLGEASYRAEIEKSTVTLNPRYGVLDPKQKAVVANGSSSLSEPAPATAP